MATGRKKPSKAKCKADPWALGDAFGLREDGGWVDALKQEWAGSSPDARACWEELLTLCRDARPRCNEEWEKAQHEAESKCGWPPTDYHLDVAEPGTDACQEALQLASPDETWFLKVRGLTEVANATGFSSRLARVCRRAVQSGIGSLNRNTPNREILRALIWCAAAIADPENIDALRQLASRSLAHKTAQARTIGIALASVASEHAAAALRMIEVSAKRPSHKERFARYASHVERRIGLTAEDSAERFIPTFGLDADGAFRTVFPEHGAVELRIEQSRAVTKFFSASGKEVVALPAAIKRDHAQALQELRVTSKALAKLINNQRDRIESLFISRRSWDLATWRARYLEHPVVGALAKRLIWDIDDAAFLLFEDNALDVRSNAVSLSPSARVKLWHPLGRSAAEVQAWRHRLESLGVTQPFKQAHREIYLLTDAERQTLTYSNRFAAHILRQPQFRALASARGWHAPLLGLWDSGDSGVARREVADQWRVEFWLYAAGDEQRQDLQSPGLLHIATDQVRFYRRTEVEPSRLEDVPPIIFSEGMRDVDLFVGVASVGNDATWADGGPEGLYRDYWQRYSFGDLGESAKTREQVLQRIIPKLKIANQCSFQEKFLVVKGSLRTYKIHLGSGNILMEPNDQYLCIVPKAAEIKDSSILLPFEGDRTLSVILSKAFLLADDSQISDPGILGQIRR